MRLRPLRGEPRDQSLRLELQVRRRGAGGGSADLHGRLAGARAVRGAGGVMTPRPVHLLTGDLGSGKTTLLSRLLRQPALADTAVVINEPGEVGLDPLLVDRASEDDVVLLDSRCL